LWATAVRRTGESVLIEGYACGEISDRELRERCTVLPALA
jgi:hypothetical protein